MYTMIFPFYDSFKHMQVDSNSLFGNNRKVIVDDDVFDVITAATAQSGKKH